MIVCAYSENIFGDKSEEVHLWRRQWSRFGFDPVIYDESLCKNHPRYQDMVDRIRHYPTVNVRRYEDVCYLRWLGAAMTARLANPGELIVQADTDVLPFDLCPLDITSPFAVTPRPPATQPHVLVFDRGIVPCMVGLDQEGAEWVVDLICSNKCDQGDPYFIERPGDPVHMSDMRIFQWANKNLLRIAGPPLCVQFGDNDPKDPRINWSKAKAVHFSAGAVGQFRPGWDKTRAMRIEILARTQK